MLTPAITARAQEIKNSGDLREKAPRLPKTTDTTRVQNNRPENRLGYFPGHQQDGRMLEGQLDGGGGKKNPDNLFRPVIAAQAPGVAAPLGQGVCIFRKILVYFKY